MIYRSSTTFTDQRNQQTRHMKHAKETKNALSNIRICKNHPSSPWGQDQLDNWLPQCYYGHTTGTTCELLKVEKGVAPDIYCECGEYGIKKSNTYCTPLNIRAS